MPVRVSFTIAAMAGLAAAAPLTAQPWGGPMLPPSGEYGRPGAFDPREGKVDAVTYAANVPAAAELGRGPVAISAGAGSMPSGPEEAIWESALVDQLVKAGYQTDAPKATAGQSVEFVVSHDVIQPEEPPHSPVSGEATVGVGNRGSWGGVAVAVDMSKPLKALIETRLDARIRDAATHELLWEGHARVISREGDKHWTGQALAVLLAAALFRGFPKPIAR